MANKTSEKEAESSAGSTEAQKTSGVAQAKTSDTSSSSSVSPQEKQKENATSPPKTEDSKPAVSEDGVKDDSKTKSDKEKTTDGESKAIPEKKEVSSVNSSWKPKTGLGIKVKSGEMTDIDSVLESGMLILEPEIIETLIPHLDSELLMIGQAKGKFGGGQRRVFRQTQKKTREGNKPKFSTGVIVGNRNGHLGLGYGKSKETVPAREKAIRNAKLNLIRIKRGCGSWACSCGEAHSIPFKVSGKCGSVKITLMPAPKGTGLCVEKECAKMLAFAGIKDCWSKTIGHTKTKINLIKACFIALRKLSETRVLSKAISPLGIVDGRVGKDVIIEKDESNFRGRRNNNKRKGMRKIVPRKR